MDKLQQLYFCRIMLDSNRDESAIWQALDVVYADGYVDRHESSLLDAIAKSDLTQNPSSATAHVDAYAKTTIQKLLTEKVFYAGSYQRFRQMAAPQIASAKIGLNVSLTLEDLQPTANGGFQLTLTIRDRDFVKKLEVALPDAQGKYPNGTQTGFENALDEKIKGLLVKRALSAAYDNSSGQFDPILLQKAYDALSRMGQKNRSEAKKEAEAQAKLGNEGFTTGNGYGAETNHSKEIGQRAAALATNRQIIRGIEFKMPPSEDLVHHIDEVLAAYPDYVLQAWARTGFTVTIFDSSQIHPDLFKEGIFQSPREAMLGWADSKEKKIFLDCQFLYELPHELSHALENSAPSYLWPLLEFQDGDVGFFKTYGDAKSRIHDYPEEVFAEEYEDANLDEQLAELPVIYYGGHGVSATSDELKTEEPVPYLCLEMMDEILRRYDFSGNNADIPPIWFAYTEMARVFAQKYLETYGASWHEEANLKKFRQTALQLDFTTEIDFWKAHDQFREHFKGEAIFDYGITKSRYFEVAEKMAVISSKNEFFQNEATLARHQKNLRVGSFVPLLIETPGPVIDGRGPIVKVVANVSKITDRGMVVVFTCEGKKWEQEIFCTGEPVNLYYGEDNSYIGTVYLDFVQE